MDKMADSHTSVAEIVDGYVNYKINRYRTKIDMAFKKLRGEVVCDSDIIMQDLLEPQFFVNSVSE